MRTSIGINIWSVARSNSTIVDFNAVAVAAGATVLQSVQTDLGVTLSGSNVAALADQSGSGLDYSQATPGNQPVYTAGGLAGFPIITFDGTATYLSSSLNLPVPGTTPWRWIAVVRQKTWVSSRWFVGPGVATSAATVFQYGATPAITQYNGVVANSNTSAALNQWVFLEAYFSNSTSDSLGVGATIQTGASAGNNNPNAGRVLGGHGTGLTLSNYDLAMSMYILGAPDTASTALRAAVASKYLGLVSV